jgi:predicted DCC family thiol-disulfide oxidoreductase YuxK
MISLTSEMTDSKGRHARGWLFFDAECDFCTRTATWLARPMQKRGLALQPLQDPRVASLLCLTQDELKHTIRFVRMDGTQYLGADAVLAVAREFWWTRPLAALAQIPGCLPGLRAIYDWAARRRRCPAQQPKPEISLNSSQTDFL